jgi:hypothetical protein
MAFTARSKKIVKEKGAEPDEFEESVAQVWDAKIVATAVKSLAGRRCADTSNVLLFSFLQALFDLEATNAELKADLRDLYITSAKEIEIHGTSRKAIIVHVRQLLLELKRLSLGLWQLYDNDIVAAAAGEAAATAAEAGQLAAAWVSDYYRRLMFPSMGFDHDARMMIIRVKRWGWYWRLNLRHLYFAAQVPFRLLKAFHKIQQRLVRELEKKFSGKDVVIVANRRIMPPQTTGVSNSRPRSRTLTAVSI